ncbi:MAG: ARMT1-like domain-containing protein [Pseudomonadota bacterium]
MQVSPECRLCLLRLIDQATELATEDALRRDLARRAAQLIMDDHFGTGMAPARIATRFHEEIKRATGNPDPFLPLKRREMAFSRKMAEGMGILGRTLAPRPAALVALAGNAFDFFRELDVVRMELEREVIPAVDDLDEALGGLSAGDSVLYLADNAGEQFFDAPLLAGLVAMGCRVTYAVKARPVQNDLCMADVVEGLPPAGVELLSTGGAAVGMDLASSSDVFRARLAEKTSLVIAKGMGHYETAEELPAGRVLLLLKAKCQVVAQGLGVARDSFVARLLPAPQRAAVHSARPR